MADRAMRKTPFGVTRDGRPAHLYTLANRSGLEVVLSDFGATTVRLRVPDRDGRVDDVVLGHASLAEYEDGRFFIGGTIGRYANRIAGGEFTLNGKKYAVSTNTPPNHLHGGFVGFHKRLWDADLSAADEGEAVTLSYVSPDDEEGFPGNLTVNARFSISAARNDLRVAFDAFADQDTILNLTTHPYFNLSGASGGDILSHQLLIHAHRFTPVDAAMIPTGELRDVRNSPFDFTRLTAIGARIDDDHPQLTLAGGYDHNWALDAGSAGEETHAAELFDPASGRRLEIFTTEPGIQFYSGNSLDGSVANQNGAACGRRSALCLETQHFPDSPNHANSPSVVLRRGRRFRSSTTYRFSAI
jgi:aldose 1-epimerase